jgi:hypothetical protein
MTTPAAPGCTMTIAVCYFRFLFHDEPRKGSAYHLERTRYEVLKVAAGKVYLNVRKMRGTRG